MRRSKGLRDRLPEPAQRRRVLLRRGSYHAFLETGVIQLSYFHWLLMGLIDSDFSGHYSELNLSSKPGRPESGAVA